MKRIFMTGYSGNRGGVETFMDLLSAELNDYEIIYRLPVMEIDGKIWKAPANRHNYLKYRFFWKKFFRENRFDILYYNTCDIVSIDMLVFAKEAGIPVRVIHAHSAGNQMAIEKGLSLFHRVCEKRNRKNLGYYATHFFACSEKAGKWMFGDHPFTVIQNGICLGQYRYNKECRRKLRNLIGIDNGLLVGIIGRLDPPKNPLGTVRILKSLMTKDMSSQAIFLGDGTLRRETEAAVHESALNDRVTFMGNVENVNEWLSAIDLLLMPSLFEGFPFVLVEAQAAGVPCIVSSSVPKEADLTGLVFFEDLEASPDVWADRILMTEVSERQETGDQLKEAGYSIESTANLVRKILEQSE